MFDNFLNSIPYPIRGGIIRGVRVGLAAVIAGVTASILDGSLFNLIHVIPTAYAPVFTMAATTFLTALDKWLRERGLLEDAKEAGVVPPEAKEIPAEVKSTVEVALTDDKI